MARVIGKLLGSIVVGALFMAAGAALSATTELACSRADPGGPVGCEYGALAFGRLPIRTQHLSHVRAAETAEPGTSA